MGLHQITSLVLDLFHKLINIVVENTEPYSIVIIFMRFLRWVCLTLKLSLLFDTQVIFVDRDLCGSANNK